MVDLITMQEIAADLGLPLSTVHTYRKRSERNRRSGEVRPGDLPPHTVLVGRTPAWDRQVYLAWKQSRPGRGAAGHKRQR